MKKILCLILTIVITLSCLCSMPFSAGITATAKSFETENGVQVEMAPFLYKSTLYQMEFPSHQSYDIKEKSVVGDYAISRELNDLSYTFVFPAGTTKIECLVSLTGETDWRGFSVNDTKNPNYWEKDEDGNIDYSKPLTFKRNEITAEQDEYGVLYRDYLKDKDVQGFRDYNKIYWKLNYICGGEAFTECFDIKVYDYDEAEKYTLKTVNFNVAGLPFAAFTGENVAANQKAAGKYLSGNDFDIVAVQEDFGYHKSLLESMSGFNYLTNHTGSIPGGDGLNIFTKNMPVYNETRVAWNEAYGILSDGSDELTPKGFVYTVIDIGNGIYVDFYNLHADAYAGAGSVAARTSQYKQLAEFIKARSAENDRPVIVTGDFNNHIHTHEDDGALYKTLYLECGLKDAWIEYHNNGDYFNMYNWHITGLPAWGNWDSVERFMYKSGGGVDIVVSDFRYIEVTDDNEKVISDHSAAECDFTFIKTTDFIENTQELEIVKASGNDFLHRIMWFFKALIMVLSDLGNLPELLKDLA
ncbi:MAG: endonuclease/exonuclease/phosphatase family protein [Clostridia bacterium]|nr:endonuclease/exonuclease/phosphatase family protein [Clostridia bacterium]